MTLLLIAVAFIGVAGIAGARSVFADKLAAAYLKDARTFGFGPEAAVFTARARKAEIVGSRWDNVGVSAALIAIVTFVFGLVDVLSGWAA